MPGLPLNRDRPERVRDADCKVRNEAGSVDSIVGPGNTVFPHRDPATSYRVLPAKPHHRIRYLRTRSSNVAIALTRSPCTARRRQRVTAEGNQEKRRARHDSDPPPSIISGRQTYSPTLPVAPGYGLSRWKRGSLGLRRAFAYRRLQLRHPTQQGPMGRLDSVGTVPGQAAPSVYKRGPRRRNHRARAMRRQ